MISFNNKGVEALWGATRPPIQAVQFESPFALAFAVEFLARISAGKRSLYSAQLGVRRSPQDLTDNLAKKRQKLQRNSGIFPIAPKAHPSGV